MRQNNHSCRPNGLLVQLPVDLTHHFRFCMHDPYRFRMWMDSVSELFGGLDMCAISALRGRDNKDYIIEVNDCCMPLIGDKQEEDKRAIADLVMNKMELIAKGLPDAKLVSVTSFKGVYRE